MTRLGLLFLVLVLFLLQGAALQHARGEDEDEDAPRIRNPYFTETEWRVWRDDATPLEDVTSMVREGKEKKAKVVTLTPVVASKRIYPEDPPKKASASKPYVIYGISSKPSSRYAGIWDDVYTSWSGLHGYVRPSWRGPDGSKVAVRDQILHFVDVKKANTKRAGVNFIHQSTTGMAHTITNGYSVEMTTNYEKLYFADCLLTSPAHASFTELDDRTSDLYIAHVPTLFNSVGSSNSETMAITKMIIAGGYLPPATKLLLKRNGLYPGALLSMWKAALPYDEPYDHELRHRIAYKSVGNRETYPEKYSAAGINRGDKALPFHRYDDLAHMRAMVDLARSMDVAPPEALLSVIRSEGGTRRYALRKAAVVIQEEGEDVELVVSTEGCYDLQDLPLSTRWKLLYGNRDTTVEPDPEDPYLYTIRVPWNDALPEGRTALALIANNGRFDSNPAILTIYRKKSDLPGHGGSPKDYKYPGTHANRRPILLDLQDVAVRRGRELRIALRAIDPEGFPVAFYKRAGEPGTIDGDLFTWRCPRKTPRGPRTLTIIASDGTSGNSYGGKQITVYVGKKPKLMAHITADKLVGPAPLKVRFSAKGSKGVSSKTKFGWDFIAANAKTKKKAFKELEPRRDLTHTFAKPGLYRVELTLQGAESDTETVHVLVTDGATKAHRGGASVLGNGVRIRPNDDTPSAFDHTDFGSVAVKETLERVFVIENAGADAAKLQNKSPVTIDGEAAADFKVHRRPRTKIDAGGRTRFVIRFKPSEAGPRGATVHVHLTGEEHSFAIRGTGRQR